MRNLNQKLCLFLILFSLSIKLDAQDNQIKSKFDFIAGEKVIFFDDFSSENIGDFPSQWSSNGSGEIVNSSKFPGRWLQLTKAGYYMPDVDAEFTENYTIEFDIIPSNTIQSETATGILFFFLAGDRKSPGYGSQPGPAGFRFYPDYSSVFWNNWSEAREWQGENGAVEYMVKSAEKYHLSLWIQKQRVRIYINENKILDLPNGLQKGYKYDIFRIETSADANPLLGNFRIAAGLPDMRNKLITEGKLISYGILFDVNSDKIKPESLPTIKEIAQVLKDNPTIKIKIVGHTDTDGEDTKNLDLSKRRAMAVKNDLVNKFSIDGTRVETDGKGETEPVAKNDSALNKAKNRRVEFIKL